MKYQIPKGTFDIIPYGTEERWRLSEMWQFVETALREVSFAFGYREIRTPIYEASGLFDRGVGTTSDIVTKEMFTFEDKGGRLMTLRPEGTSSVMRAFIENRLANLGPVHKLFYTGPMFRYERPQSGRYRQHHQFGVEAIGNSCPEQDAEVIDLLWQFYQKLGLKNLRVHINTVGDLESRGAFKNALLAYLEPHFSKLSEESQTRFEKNPLRILDSKNPQDREILQKAPSILDYLGEASATHFQKVCAALERIEIPYVIDDKIVRGLDYYQKTVFEILADDLGAQNTIGAGGRFDGLIKTFGGADLPAVGFATGLERVIQTMLKQDTSLPPEKRPLIYFFPMGEEALKTAFSLVTQLRRAAIPADIEFHTQKVQSALQNANRLHTKFLAIIGSEELSKQTLQLKDLESRVQEEVSFENLCNKLRASYTIGEK
ncbi:MAG: histidine--tRNA ligase [Chlamydiae bacterium RIFCSPHIGHO2_12_FULL_44_59]|nr:MAG: histidine--tRNA ligase [Chlamydiae bacterium RIFCSPHIGHO2_01_FULL_44_39]OGN58874.1 MAG: histidine--tRNA ligase [Chlamydiae bacterium RIFCSPHIGHO2_02_FULL_45_9]OGN60509.1 MAG: histidine--tRNA ligase [Chlamydiae bacterium RIFCSPHIGHO2_12_FULL_44_59]OGN65963.1 MAG: histidine--tRNA ligase [Chlamydiae bacterium RIFCSPLOWO2_01_FULL_44_52]OGN68778.1 MAG: histidine--tRNA ligase [Chlamydiae bacterium RIFCSPLOWO2_02_FULL_45_22]OGN70419.1 MAG: histidine--tRNA ligase [Chlamydiae bacterium RIFCSPLO